MAPFSSPSASRARPAPFFGWTVVAAAFVVAIFGWGLGFYGPPVYLEAVRQARGWSVALVSGAVTTHFLAGVVVVANLPRLHARFGVPAVTMAGAIALALGVLGWALARTEWQLYAATLLSGGGWVTLGAAAVNAIVSPWFATRRPAALSAAYNGASIGGVIFSPLWVWLIGTLGFPVAATIVGLTTVAIIALLAATILGRTPAAMGQVPDGVPLDAAAPARRSTHAPARLWRDRAFLTLAAGMALALFAQIGLIAHLVSLLVPALGPGGAGLAAGLSTAAAILGRTLVGWLMPSGADRRAVASLSLLVQMAGCAALAAAAGSSVPLLLIGTVLIGLGIGNATSLPPLVAQTEFSPAVVGRVVALIVAVSQGAYAFAPAAFGAVRAFGSDIVVFGLAASIQLAAVGVYLAGRGARGGRAGSREPTG